MAEMLALVAPKYTPPAGYQLQKLPKPAITNAAESSDVLIAVRAASCNPIDTKLAGGMFKATLSNEFPHKLGYDAAGVVEAVGQLVSSLKVGDEVYVRLPEVGRGSFGEFVKCPAEYVALKPKTASFNEAASLPLAGVTALQALRRYRGDLKGKTVFVPAGLGGAGAFACQLAKNVFGAGKVISTVSTAKVSRVPELLGQGVVDQIIDYTKEDPTKAIPPQSVDFILDTTGQAMAFLHLVKPKTSTIISISTMPSGTQLQGSSFFHRPDNPQMPWVVKALLNVTDSFRKLRAQRYGTEYSYMFLDGNGKDLEILAGHVDAGKVKPVVGTTVKLTDVEAVKAACELVYTGKGGTGKTVIEVS